MYECRRCNKRLFDEDLIRSLDITNMREVCPYCLDDEDVYEVEEWEGEDEI